MLARPAWHSDALPVCLPQHAFRIPCAAQHIQETKEEALAERWAGGDPRALPPVPVFPWEQLGLCRAQLGGCWGWGVGTVPKSESWASASSAIKWALTPALLPPKADEMLVFMAELCKL